MDTATGAEQIHWDLSDLYTSAEDPALKTDVQRLKDLTGEFSQSYKNKLSNLNASELREALQKYEEIQDMMARIGSYAYLNWTTNTEDPALGKLVQETNELGSELSQQLVFFDIEWLALPEEDAQKLIQDDELSGYRHYLQTSRDFKPYILSEEQEQLLSAKSVTGKQAWTRFFDETLGAARFKLDGKELTEQEILSKLHQPDRELRKRSAAALTEGFQNLNRSLTYIFNTLLADKATNDKLRGYKSWISSRNLSNEIKDETVDHLVSAVTDAYPLAQRYYRLKGRLLGLDQMQDYDRYAPLLKNESTIAWEKAQETVLQAYGRFHPEMGEVAGKFFEHNWIDAAIRPGKRGGAYSASTADSVHPYVFMNYDGSVRDVQTLAHELGHGVHQYVSRIQGPLQSGTPLTTAETASVFGEMLVFQDLLAGLESKEERLALLLGKIDDSMATVFRQISMNRFEDAMHTARREEGELTSDRLSALWMQTQRDLYGDSVHLNDHYGLWWSYIPHFMHTPGYVYAYAFGELLVLSLYEKYRQQPDGFADRYMEILRAGGSESPETLTSRMGVDINQRSFWQEGIGLIEQLVAQAEALAEELNY
jgi:oligoendopeptidase F